MPIYKVNAMVTMIVKAVDESQAHDVAANNFISEQLEYCQTSDVQEVTKLSELDKLEGWDGACLPYGGDGNTELSELLTI